MKRRKFIRQTSGFAAGLALAPLAGSHAVADGGSEQDYPIIDTHQHLWDKDKFRLKWTKDPIDKGDFLLPEYRKEVNGLNVVKTIYMEVDIPEELQEYEADFALNLCKDPTSKMAGAVVHGDPSNDNFRDFVSKFSNDPHLKGVRCRFTSKEAMLSNQAIENLRWLGDQGLLFDLGIPPTWLGDSLAVVEQCQDTTFILNHCGTADPVALFPPDVVKPRESKYDGIKWKRDIEALGDQGNVVCKISGIVAHVRGYDLQAKHLAPTINHCLDSFGPDRVVFAGDWPTCLYNMPLRQWILTLKAVVKSRKYEEQKKLFHDNARRIYRV
ncbi:MAG: amidohydrolase family protein [Cyclobacteriaceae bacterium]